MKKIISVLLAGMLCLGLVCALMPEVRADESPVKKGGKAVTSADDLRLYDIVTFGNYPIRSYNAYGPIEWFVVKKNGNKVTLLTRDLIDSKPYHNKNMDLTWQMSDLYAWLNDTFKANAFTAAEQDLISGGITIPSLAEARALPGTVINAEFTPYAAERGGDTEKVIWWLRDGMKGIDAGDGKKAYCASVVRDGSAYAAAYKITFNHKGVRPMLVIDLKHIKDPDSPTAGNGGIEMYDDVTFGSYPQDNGSEYDPIHWIVIGKNGNKVKLLSALALDCQKYQDPYAAVSWRYCTLNAWLNDTFRNMAFSEAEQKVLSGDVTILSEAEARELPAEYRVTRSTQYAIAQGADPSRCIWWLQDSMMRQVQDYWWSEKKDVYCASAMRDNGEIGSGYYRVDFGQKTVRPVIVVELP